MRAADVLERLCAASRGREGSPRTIVVAAHPDDETIGAGARIWELGACHVAYVTDGAPMDKRWFPESVRNLSRTGYARMRRQEAIAALARAGLDETRVVGLGARDQEAAYDLVGLTERLVSMLVELRPELIVTHAYEGGHPDHDAAAFVAHAATAIVRIRGLEPPPLVEMTAYHDRSGTTVRGEFLPVAGMREVTSTLSDEARKAKRSMLSAYATQREALAPFGTELERFRMAPRYDFTTPPHDGRLHYERVGFPLAPPMWRAFARAAIRRLKLGDDRWL